MNAVLLRSFNDEIVKISSFRVARNLGGRIFRKHKMDLKDITDVAKSRSLSMGLDTIKEKKKERGL